MQFDQLRRREFITLLGGAAAAWPLAARAQQGGKPLAIGFLGATTAVVDVERIVGFRHRLSELGWIEGRNLVIEMRWAEGRDERATEIAVEFVRLRVDVIVTSGLPGVLAAKRATTAVPIVFGTLADPVGTGVVASLARPGGNITGLSNLSTAGKRIELLQEIIPHLRRLAIIVNAGNLDAMSNVRDAQATAAALGLEITQPDIRSPQDIAAAFEGLAGRADALYVVADPLLNTARARIHTLSMAARLPAIYNNREQVEAGGLMSYGPSFPDLWRRTAELVDKILRGAKPADIPVEQPTKFNLVINLTTAKALGLTIPESFLLRADEVIE